MKIITHRMIEELNLNSHLWYEWVEEVLKNKHLYIMPPKTSLHFGTSYFNTMPSILPNLNTMGVKVVNRYIGRMPSIESQLLLFDYTTGNPLALIDANLITAMRTAAVTIHSMQMFARPNFSEIGVMGFGNIGLACMKIMLSHFKDIHMKVKLLKYKDHAEKVKDIYKSYSNVNFEIVETLEELITNSDVVISCITYTDKLLGKNEWFKEGCLVIPVHLRGFQNCDLFFDKIFGDDKGQVCSFKYFSQFKYFAETSEVLRGEKIGRQSDSERILSYNVGMSLHDIFAATKIYEYFREDKDIPRLGPTTKYWI